MQRHDFDPIAFVFGIVFTGLGVLFMTGRPELLNHAQWLWPGLLVLLGLAVLLGTRGRGGARAARPALEMGSRVDPAMEDEVLHSPVTTLDSELLVDTRSLFTLQPHTPTQESPTASLPEADKSESPAGPDTTVLPKPDPKPEPEPNSDPDPKLDPKPDPKPEPKPDPDED